MFGQICESHTSVKPGQQIHSSYTLDQYNFMKFASNENFLKLQVSAYLFCKILTNQSDWRNTTMSLNREVT